MRLERAYFRFVERAMHGPFSLPVVGSALLAAIAFGVHLGESTVGLINPIYFQAPPLHPRDRGAAIDENRLPRAAPTYAELYGWEQGYAARAVDCGDCEALLARDAFAYSARVPYFGGGTERRPTVTDARAALAAHRPEPPAEAAPRIDPVERYAHYPIAADRGEGGPETDEADSPDDVKKPVPEAF